ncbi:MAG: formyltetrahydrofolate deformylase [Xanthobacteraceae bacterium]
MSTPATAPTFILILTCPDRRGIVAAVSTFLADAECNILESAQFGDEDTGRFFLRISFHSPGKGLKALKADFAPIAGQFDMQAEFFDAAVKLRTLVMVSRLGHCLNDLLYRNSIGAIPMDLRLVVSNHTDLQTQVGQNQIPFHHMPVTPENKAEQEARLIALIEAENIELIVLARYMQVMSEAFCARYPGRIINIHHSFLPSFKGAKPYHRAHSRGVKLIGATAHYVTSDLDEGPIIEQSVERVRHNFTPDDLVALGRDVETVVLARAVHWHAERRVLLNESRTVIFQ